MNYFLGSTGRSFVVGFGKNPPKEPHHRGSSCPKYPARCDWAQSGTELSGQFRLPGSHFPDDPIDESYKSVEL